MKKATVSVFIVLLIVANSDGQRRPPVIGRHLPEPGPHRIEVRFAIGAKAVKCEYFHLFAKVEDRVLIDDRFASGFLIPPDAENLPKKEALILAFTCGRHHWRFTKVPESAFESGWWWVGTDLPPFQETFEGSTEFQNAVWIRYLIVDPGGFFVEKHCPATLKDQKPGPCYD